MFWSDTRLRWAHPLLTPAALDASKRNATISLYLRGVLPAPEIGSGSGARSFPGQKSFFSRAKSVPASPEANLTDSSDRQNACDEVSRRFKKP